MSVPNYHQVSTISAGLRCACPRCGRGKLYDGLLSVAAKCSECELDYGRFDSHDGPAFFIIVVWSAVVLPLAVWLEFALEPPIWVHMLIWVPVVLVGAIALMRPLKAWMIAQQYRHQVYDNV